MTPAGNIRALQRLLVLHYRSLPTYLGSLCSWGQEFWVGPDADRFVETVRHMIADQHDLVDRLASAIQDRGGMVHMGEFPMRFTDMHDLSNQYLVACMIECQQQDLAVIELCVAQISGDAMAEGLARECLGAAKAHLQSLGELAAADADLPAAVAVH